MKHYQYHKFNSLENKYGSQNINSTSSMINTKYNHIEKLAEAGSEDSREEPTAAGSGEEDPTAVTHCHECGLSIALTLHL